MTEEKEIVTTRTYTIGDIREALKLERGATLKFVYPSREITPDKRPDKYTFMSVDNTEVLVVTIREPYTEKK